MKTDEIRFEAVGGTAEEAGSNGGSIPGEGIPQPGAERFWGGFRNARSGRSNPGAGGGSSRGNGSGHGSECLEWCPICRSADLIRGSAPPDLRGQLEAIQQEAFNVMKAFVAAYAEKSTPSGTAARRSAAERSDGEVEIPIE